MLHNRVDIGTNSGEFWRRAEVDVAIPIQNAGAETRERAKVLAVNGGVVLQIGPRIEILRDDGMPVRVIFDKIPPNLRAKPTLSITVDSKSAGTRPATLSYLTNGLGWAADYVSLYDEKAGTIDVQGWVTLTNTSGTNYVNAKTILVAGSAGSSGGPARYTYQPTSIPGNSPGIESAPRERLGDYYLYPLRERTTSTNVLATSRRNRRPASPATNRSAAAMTSPASASA